MFSHNINVNMVFETDGKRFLLTWPQSGALTKAIIRMHLGEIGKIEYVLIGQEQHSDGGEHFHAVVIYEKRIKRRKNVFTINEFVCNVKRIKNAMADLKRAIKYVEKEDVNPYEEGERPECAKKLDKREKLYFILQNDNKKCIDSGHFNIFEVAKLDMVRQIWNCEWPQFQKRTVKWFWGPTGTGKTRMAWQELMHEYKINQIWCSSGKLEPFFIGYVNQRAVILDDLRPGSIRFELLLRILDGYPVHVNVKGGQSMWMAEKIIITAPCKPSEMYVNRETGETWDNLDQLLRRINEFKEFTKDLFTELWELSETIEESIE